MITTPCTGNILGAVLYGQVAVFGDIEATLPSISTLTISLYVVPLTQSSCVSEKLNGPDDEAYHVSTQVEPSYSIIVAFTLDDGEIPETSSPHTAVVPLKLSAKEFDLGSTAKAETDRTNASIITHMHMPFFTFSPPIFLFTFLNILG